MNEIVQIDGAMVRLSPMMAWAYHEERDWKKFNREKRKRTREVEKSKSP